MPSESEKIKEFWRDDAKLSIYQSDAWWNLLPKILGVLIVAGLAGWFGGPAVLVSRIQFTSCTIAGAALLLPLILYRELYRKGGQAGVAAKSKHAEIGKQHEEAKVDLKQVSKERDDLRHQLLTLQSDHKQACKERDEARDELEKLSFSDLEGKPLTVGDVQERFTILSREGRPLIENGMRGRQAFLDKAFDAFHQCLRKHLADDLQGEITQRLYGGGDQESRERSAVGLCVDRLVGWAGMVTPAQINPDFRLPILLPGKLGDALDELAEIARTGRLLKSPDWKTIAGWCRKVEEVATNCLRPRSFASLQNIIKNYESGPFSDVPRPEACLRDCLSWLDRAEQFLTDSDVNPDYRVQARRKGA